MTRGTLHEWDRDVVTFSTPDSTDEFAPRRTAKELIEEMNHVLGYDLFDPPPPHIARAGQVLDAISAIVGFDVESAPMGDAYDALLASETDEDRAVMAAVRRSVPTSWRE